MRGGRLRSEGGRERGGGARGRARGRARQDEVKGEIWVGGREHRSERGHFLWALREGAEMEGGNIHSRRAEERRRGGSQKLS